MKDRPILFSGPMIRALLDGRKTQTRRVVTPQPEVSEQGNLIGEWLRRPLDGPLRHKLQDITVHCPYGIPGDRLWVRESGWERPELSGRDRGKGAKTGANTGPRYEYDATLGYIDPAELKAKGWKRRPSIHMPRWASRITLEVTGVRVERLREISATDAWAEGIPHAPDVNPVHEYQELWDGLNAARGYGWDVNPWVWVVGFRRSA